MTEQAPDISVIICAYTSERWEYLRQAVKSVQEQTLLPVEIIVVIDHNPELLECARMHLSRVVVMENHDVKGLAGARNDGAAVAQGEVIAYLDDDAIAADDWLERLASCYEDPSVMGVGGSIQPVWLSGRPKWFPREFDWVVGCTYRGMPQSTAPVRNLIGANMSFRKDIFEIVGGFQTGIGQVGISMLRCDDTEFCIRVHQRWGQGFLLYEPRARVYHRVPANRARWDYFRSRCYTEGLAKALVSRFVGVRDGLASERTHALRTLPRGIVHGAEDTLLRCDLFGLARSVVIVAGLIFTTVGYIRGLISARLM